MEIKKFNLDRKTLSEEDIKSKQNFSKILQLTSKPGIWKNPWFYGSIGLTSFAAVLLLTTDFETKKQFNVKTSTFSNKPKTFISYSHVEKAETLKPNRDHNQSKIVQGVKNVAEIEMVKVPNSEIENKNSAITKLPVTTDVNYKVKRGIPSIGGVSNGTIKSSVLIESEIIESGFDYKIDSYKVNYFNGYKEVEERLDGNALPILLREKLVEFNVGEIIFFTDIRSVDDVGVTHDLPSMNFKIINN